jgi:hypothetical protein
MVDKDSMHTVLRGTCGQAEYKYPTGEIFMVNIDMAGIGTKRIRIANLPPEVHNGTVHEALAPFGKVLNIYEEKWARYSVPNGVRQVSLHLTRHLPSHMIIAGNRVLISYEGQPVPCYGCGAIWHLHQGCPMRRVKDMDRQGPEKTIYAYAVTNTVTPHSKELEDKNTTTDKEESQNTPITLTETPQTTSLSTREDKNSFRNRHRTQSEDTHGHRPCSRRRG